MRAAKAPLSRINPRPGVVVCICGKHGTIIRHDPEGYMRTPREQFARAKKKKEAKEDDDD
ncbi:MAG: hypothetical protein IJ313_10490 [Clostridia bacterium]|nr:hypothetical protein [Clostridia bacterium]